MKYATEKGHLPASNGASLSTVDCKELGLLCFRSQYVILVSDDLAPYVHHRHLCPPPPLGKNQILDPPLNIICVFLFQFIKTNHLLIQSTRHEEY